jgi:hypothetical protein
MYVYMVSLVLPMVIERSKLMSLYTEVQVGLIYIPKVLDIRQKPSLHAAFFAVLATGQVSSYHHLASIIICLSVHRTS